MKTVGTILVLSIAGFVSSWASTQPSRTLAPIKVGVFEQEIGRSYDSRDGLPSDNVLCVAIAENGDVYAGTDKGLARFRDGRWESVSGVPSEPVRRLAISGETVYVGLTASVISLGNPLAGYTLPKAISALSILGNDLWIGTEEGLYRVKEERLAAERGLNELLGTESEIRQIALAPDGRVVVAARAGLFERVDGDWKRSLPRDGKRSWAVSDTRGVVFDQQKRLWFCSPQGVGRWDGEWELFTGREGLPYDDFVLATPGGDGAVWFATRIGAIRYDGQHWAYREGRRWLPGNDVRDIAVASDGYTWFATDRGVGSIERHPMTLAEKAKFYEDEIDRYHRRTPYGYVMSVNLEKPGDKSQWRQRDDDNDGQWTGEYGAAECFAYAATKDPLAKKRATAAFEALRFFSQVTQGGSHPAPKGFPARTILPVDGPRNPNEEESYSLEADLKRKKSDLLWKTIQPHWPTSADGKWYWKCDTSSDELDGHYFLNARYYDLVAETEEEKDRVRQVVRDMTDHLIEHDYKLVDHDGKPTRWANFNPDTLNRDPWWWTERGLNSLSILSYLRVAEHITGDEKYGALAEELAWKEAYAMNAMYPKYQRGPGSFVQFDDEMAFMNYYNLLLYEKDPRVLEMMTLSFFEYWELLENELDPFFNFAHAALCEGKTVKSQWGVRDLSPDPNCIEVGVETLRRYPMNLLDWKQTNSHRIDVVPLSRLVREEGDAEGKGHRVNGKVLPVDERYIKYWSDDPWSLDTGGEGKELATGMPFLLAYYMGLYHGYIVE